MTRPKDLEPDIFGSKEEAWSKFKDGFKDYTDAIHPGCKLQLDWALKQKEEVTREVLSRNPLGSTDEDWIVRFNLFQFLKRRTETNSEAHNIVECVGDSNGYEVWRLLGVRYEPQVGMKRLKELGELTMLQNKRCKNTAETAMIILEIDRRKRIISEIGGRAPDEDVCQNILWLSMDPSTRAHVAGKVDMDTVSFTDLRLVVQSFCNLIASTNNSGRSGGMVAMDIGSIASAPGTSGGPVISDGSSPEENDQGTAQAVWSLDEAGWPIDEEGWPLDGQLVPQADGQLNFVKGGGKGKGKGKGCFNCW